MKWALGLALLAAGAASARADSAPQFVRLQVGFQGLYKVGLFTPVELTLRGGDKAVTGTVAVTVPDSDAVDARFLTPANQPLWLAAGGELHVGLCVRFGQVRSRLTAEFISEGKAVCRRQFYAQPGGVDGNYPPALQTDQQLILTLGESQSLGLENLVRESSPDVPQRLAVAQLGDVRDLPVHWCGYEGVDSLVLCGSRPELYRDLAAGGPRMNALDQWIRMGGKLLLCVGSQGDRLLRENMPLAHFAPGTFEKTSLLAQTGSLESYCEASQPVPGVEMGQELQVARLDHVQGVVEVRENNVPLVVRAPRGFGQVTFLALDPDLPPLSRWSGRLPLLQRLLDLPTDKEEQRLPSAAAANNASGQVDLSGQLITALGQFNHVCLVPFWVVAVLLAVYILLIGPADYFFLRKLGGRMMLTWITFPLIVVAVSTAAYLAAYRLKGTKVRLNQADLIDVDVASRMVRGTTWANLFSPRLEAYNLTARPHLPGGNATQAEVLVSWLGMPGSGLGGMSSETATPLLGNRPYTFALFSRFDELRDMPVQVWSTKALTVRWMAPAAAAPRAELTDEGLFLSGEVRNSLPVPLQQCVLLYRNWAYPLGDLAPGQSAELGPAARRSQLQAVLLGEKVLRNAENKFVQVARAYDPAGVDVPEILQAMMFYEAAGGLAYTRLQNGYQGFVDGSGLLKTDRAVLVARGPQGGAGWGTEILRDGRPLAGVDDLHVRLFRFAYPVDRPADTASHP